MMVYVTDSAVAAQIRAALAEEGGLVGPAGAARVLGISTEAIRRRLERGTMPEPVASIDQGRPLWLASQIRALR